MTSSGSIAGAFKGSVDDSDSMAWGLKIHTHLTRGLCMVDFQLIVAWLPTANQTSTVNRS